MDEHLPDESHEFDHPPVVKVYANTNNNQTITSHSPSSILLYNDVEKLEDHLSHTVLKSKDSTVLFDQQPSTISSGMITAKHQLFINEPIAMKTTNVLPGVGNKYAQQLAECGFSTVRRLLGFYLMVKDDQTFVSWLSSRPQLSVHSAWLCTNALRAWCQGHL